MISLSARNRVFWLVALLAATACARQKSATVVTSQVDNAHGFKVGDSLAPFHVQCLKDSDKILAKPGVTQLVTFSTAGDCSTCMSHLSGLEAVSRAGGGPPQNFIVTWSRGQSVPEIARLYSSRPGRDVCLDSLGQAWDSLNIQHTPVTVLLISGRVAFMTDKGLTSDSSRARFISDIAGLASR